MELHDELHDAKMAKVGWKHLVYLKTDTMPFSVLVSVSSWSCSWDESSQKPSPNPKQIKKRKLESVCEQGLCIYMRARR